MIKQYLRVQTALGLPSATFASALLDGVVNGIDNGDWGIWRGGPGGIRIPCPLRKSSSGALSHQLPSATFASALLDGVVNGIDNGDWGTYKRSLGLIDTYCVPSQPVINIGGPGPIVGGWSGSHGSSGYTGSGGGFTDSDEQAVIEDIQQVIEDVEDVEEEVLLLEEQQEEEQQQLRPQEYRYRYLEGGILSNATIMAIGISLLILLLILIASRLSKSNE